MKYRRRFILVLALLCAAVLCQAQASQTPSLEVFGLRYTPADGETCVTQNDLSDAALERLGTDAATLRAIMAEQGWVLISLQPDGRQFSLGMAEKPAGIAATDAFAMTATEKDLFLQQLARQGSYGNAVWQEQGYALFSSSDNAVQNTTLRYADLTLATLYLDHIYAFRMEIIGREATQADTDLLLAAANRTLRLGAASDQPAQEPAATVPLALPDLQGSAGSAVLTYVQQDLPLTLEPIADTIGITRFTLSGVTEPDGYLRYAVNGQPSSRIRAAADGSFRFTVPNLTGDADNPIELTAFKGERKTVVQFTIRVDWQRSPLALSQAAPTPDKTVTLAGLTLPGSTVQLIKGRGTERIVVAKDGSFSITLSLPRLGENAFTVQVQSPGYHRNDFALRITRTASDAALLESLQKLVRTVEYPKLLAKPAAYEGRVVQVSGIADSPDFAGGSPRFTLRAENGDAFTVLCENLLAIHPGAQLTVLGTLTGATVTDGANPTVTLALIVP